MHSQPIRSRMNASIVFACFFAIACRSLPVLAATAPSKVVIAHAGMNARSEKAL